MGLRAPPWTTAPEVGRLEGKPSLRRSSRSIEGLCELGHLDLTISFYQPAAPKSAYPYGMSASRGRAFKAR